MISRTVVPTLLGSLLLVAGCQAPESVSGPGDPAFASAPSDGNGRKLIITVDEDGPDLECGGGTILAQHVKGWIQLHLFNHDRNLEVDVFHLAIRFANSAGRTYTFREVGPDHFYIRNGNVFLAASGRLSGGLIGHVVTNLTTLETVFIAGKEFDGVDSLACKVLT
jgi:hypothetical protein